MPDRQIAPVLSERFVTGSAVPRFDLEEWRAEFGVVAGITSAENGFDLTLENDDSGPAEGAQWRRFRDTFGYGFKGFVVGRQQHGTEIGTYGNTLGGVVVSDGLDGHATGRRGILLSVVVADCVPVYLLEPQSCSIVMLHAGWRGTASGILAKGIEELKRSSKSSAADIVMHCGISVCGSCYEVGPEVVSAVTGRLVNGRETLDLRSELVAQARRIGVRRITVSSFCTVHDEGRFHSFRRQGRQSGRMAAYLGVPMS